MATTKKRPAKKRTTSDADEFKIEWRDLLVQSLTMPGHLGDTYSRFYEYSFLNVMLLMAQGASEPVATFKRWQDMGRQVQKGERALTICRPVFGKKEQPDGTVKEWVSFKMVRCLFQASQTSGEALPDAPPVDWDLDRALAALDIQRVKYHLLNGNVQGYSYHRTVAVSPVAARPLKTMLHEVGHVVLGHTTDERLAEYGTHRGIYEFQAESVALIVGRVLGVMSDDDESACRAYIQHWMADRDENEVTEAVVKPIFAAVTKILKAGRPAKAEADAESVAA